MNQELTRGQCTCEQETEEQKYTRIGEIVAQYKTQKGSLLPVLQLAQGIYGYLPLELQQFIAKGMEIPLSEVTGVVTGYADFCTKPQGKHTISVCMGTACYVRGGKKLVDSLADILGIQIGETTEDRKYTLAVSSCLGACGLAPAMMIDDVLYKQVKSDRLEAILAKHQ